MLLCTFQITQDGKLLILVMYAQALSLDNHVELMKPIQKAFCYQILINLAKEMYATEN